MITNSRACKLSLYIALVFVNTAFADVRVVNATVTPQQTSHFSFPGPVTASSQHASEIDLQIFGEHLWVTAHRQVSNPLLIFVDAQTSSERWVLQLHTSTEPQRNHTSVIETSATSVVAPEHIQLLRWAWQQILLPNYAREPQHAPIGSIELLTEAVEQSSDVIDVLACTQVAPLQCTGLYRKQLVLAGTLQGFTVMVFTIWHPKAETIDMAGVGPRWISASIVHDQRDAARIYNFKRRTVSDSVSSNHVSKKQLFLVCAALC